MLCGLPIYTGHCEKRNAILWDSISTQPIKDIKVNSGSVEASFCQFLYIKFGVVIKNLKYPCLIQKSVFLDFELYYPLEICLCDKTTK